jgi:hypothetical protein
MTLLQLATITAHSKNSQSREALSLVLASPKNNDVWVLNLPVTITALVLPDSVNAPPFATYPTCLRLNLRIQLRPHRLALVGRGRLRLAVLAATVHHKFLPLR